MTKKIIKIEKIKIAHKDKRGSIADLINKKINHVGLIVSKKGAVRGSHYHKVSIQYDYILSGKFEVCFAPASKPSAKKRIILKKGELITIPPMNIHAFKAIEESVILNMMSKSRASGGYEKDVFRVEF